MADETERFQNAQTVMANGYEKNYGWITDFFEKEPLSDEECSEVSDIFAMFQALGDSYDELEDATGIDARWLKFRGFDGNNETRALGYARLLMERENCYPELKPQDLNSHMPTLGMYGRMLEVWRPAKMNCPAPERADQGD